MNYVKTFVVMMVAAILALGFVACGEKEKAPKDAEITIVIENKEVKLPLGESIALKVKVTPESEASKVVWTSSKPEVAVVDNQGKVSAIAVGETEVKAAIGAKLAICRVTVTPKEGEDTEVTIEIEEKDVKLSLGGSIALKVKVMPESEASKVVWASSKPDVATVDNQGKVTSQSVGETEVKAAIGDKSATCRVTVTPKEGEDTEVTIEIEEKIIKLPIGESVALKVKVTPESEVSKVVWKSSNPEVATVDEQGKVTSKGFKTADIKATIGDKSAICKVVVVVNIGEKLAIGDKPFALNEEICLQYVWDYKAYERITYKGDKPAIIDFWATWCGPCTEISPFINRLAKEFEGKAYIFKADLSENGSAGFPIYHAIVKAGNDPGIARPGGRPPLPSFLLLPADGSPPKAVIGSGTDSEAALRKFIEQENAKESR